MKTFKINYLLAIILLIGISITGCEKDFKPLAPDSIAPRITKATTGINTPWLSVSGMWIVDPCGNHVVLRGIDLIDLKVIALDRSGLGANPILGMIDLLTNEANGWYPRVLRLAVYPTSDDGDGGTIEENGWVGTGADNYYNSYLKPATDYCISKNIYFIIDWHAIDNYDNTGSDNNIVTETTNFWTYIVQKYQNTPNAIFEIFNEPKANGSGNDSWAPYKPYAQNWINSIRNNELPGKNHLILVSSPNWTESCAEAVTNPPTGGNLVFTSHIYPDIPHANYDAEFGNPSNTAPVMMTEWGYWQGGGSVLNGTYSSYGQNFHDYVNAHPNIGWTHWVGDNDWDRDMFTTTTGWTFYTSHTNVSGPLCKEWLAEKKDSDIPCIGTGTQFTITASAGANGSISPSGSVLVNQWANQTFTITANTGYIVSAVTVDGTNQGAITTYTFTNVQATHTISTTFQSAPTFTITASSGANGSISPSGSVVVAQGSNRTFTITPNSGYIVASVTVDGTNQGAITTYTFTNVQAAHTISATFTAGGTDTNIAPTGTGYGWKSNTSATSNSNRAALAGVNNNNLTTSVSPNSAGESSTNRWEAGGVVFSSTKTVSSVNFINGANASGDGHFEANCKLQFSTDGTTWTDSGWALSPTYDYSGTTASDQTFTFTGSTISNIKGVRVVGQVRVASLDNSWFWRVKEVRVIGH